MPYLSTDDPTVRTLIDVTDDGKGLMLRHEQHNVGDILAVNRKLRSVIGRGITGNKDNMRPVARIPTIVLMDAMAKGLVSVEPGLRAGAEQWNIVDQKKFRRFLNDREYGKLRTSEGKV